ncbi:M23 family metallopeptidase [Saccharothrix australiensis]|uniref:Murein DD-endopeptidase MepM/ murein hydrolase activator NlpD n=1 Tax=Saccharothrix australiensis TaxID=2072 RepID=A0A495W926_9PSEU|nr:M23 family metallopeptidase [Saccharothrix australiensis]RKT56298.1 murein DD-endopeptidase MepM/ murein hydrolase activator NlpD [Saccharothrix australiensis]
MFRTSPKPTGESGSHRVEDRKTTPLTGKIAAVLAFGTLTAGVGVVANSIDPRITPLAASTDLAAALAEPSTHRTAETRHAIEPGLETAKLMRSEGLYARRNVDQALRHASEGYAARQAEIKRQKDAEEAEKARVAAEEAEKARVAAERSQAQAQADAEARAAEEAAARPVERPVERPAASAPRASVVKPAEGTFTSGYGSRWGTTHFGVDIANSIGTPILSAMDGVVVEAGPASGFGLWVRVQHNDGTITVYGHVNEILVAQGQQVGAGQQIATMGNRGQSTGPHLHFEVWIGGSDKIDPLGWLGERGITL